MSFTELGKDHALGTAVSAAVDAGRSPVLRALTRLMVTSGGLEAFLKRFSRHGHGEIAQSWVGKGRNLPISERQLADIFSKKELEKLAQDAGVPKDTLLQQMAHALPSIIDRLTPNGVLPSQMIGEDEIRSAGAEWLRAALH